MSEKYTIKEISLFLAITFILTWGIWLLALSKLNLTLSNETLILIGTWIPSFVGILMTYKSNGINGLIKLVKSIFNIRISVKWYLYIFGVMPAIMAIAYVYLSLSGSAIPKSEFPLYAFPLVFMYIMILMGPLGEEAGWRGFLFKKMISRYTPFYASVVVGLIWSLWHLPLFFMETTIQAKLANDYNFTLAFCGYIIYTLMITIQISIVYINTKGNILAVILFHTMANASLGMMPLILSKSGATAVLVIMIIVTVILMVFNRNKLLDKIE